MFDFRRITLFCLEKRLSKHKMTILSKNLGRGTWPLSPPPGYAYAPARHITLATVTWDTFLVAESRFSQNSWYALSIFSVSGGGNLSTYSPVRRLKHFQSALRKFQRFTGSLWAGTLSLGGVMREGRCCDRGNFPRTRLSGSRLSWPKLAKAR